MRQLVAKVLWGALRFFGVFVVFLSALVAGVLLHLDTKGAKRAIVTQVNGLLDRTLQGDLEIEEVGGLGISGVRDARVTVRDPTGKRILAASDVDADIAPLVLARSLFGSGPIVIDLERVHVGQAELSLDGDDDGDLRIANAFEPRKEDRTPSPPSDGGDVRVELRRVVVDSLHVVGQPPGYFAPLDVDVRDLVADGRIEDTRLAFDLERAHLDARSLPADLAVRGLVEGTLTIRPELEGFDAFSFDGSFGGTALGMPTALTASMKDRKVNASLDVRDPNGLLTSSLARELAVADAIDLHAELEGTLPKLRASVDVDAGGAEANAAATIELGEPVRIEGAVHARDVDLARILRDAPRSRLGLDGRAEMTFGREGPKGTLALETTAGMLAGRRLPPIGVHGNVTRERAEARLLLREPYVRADVVASVAPVILPAGGEQTRTTIARASVAAPDLARLPILGDMLSGAAQGRGTARLVLPGGDVNASVEVEGDRVGFAGRGHARQLFVRGDVTGSLDQMEIDVEVRGEAVALPVLDGIALRSVAAQARITKTRDTLLLDGPVVKATKGEQTISVRADRVSFSPRHSTIRDARIEGLGEPVKATIEREVHRGAPASIHAVVDAPRVELAGVGQLLNMRRVLRSGTVALSADVLAAPDELRGEVHARVANAHIADLEHASLMLDAHAEGRTIDADARLRLADAGYVDITTRALELGAHPATAGAWTRATGRVGFDADIDLEKAVSLLPDPPLERLAGRLTTIGEVTRFDPRGLPDLSAHARTSGLAVEQGSWRSRNVDVAVDVLTDAPSGQLAFAARATDPAGILAAVDAKTYLPYADLVGVSSLGAVREVLAQSPLALKVIVPGRSIASLPRALGVSDVGGDVAAELDASGTILDPRIRAVAHVDRLNLPGAALRAPADASLVFTYDGSSAVLSADARIADQRVLDATSRVDVRLADLGAEAAPAWTATARGTVSRFPLGVLHRIAGRSLKGEVSGDFVVEGLHEDATARADLTLADVAVGSISYPKGRVIAFAGGGRAGASVRLVRDGSSLSARASGGARWGNRILPELDDERPLDARLQAKRFEIGVLQPFVAGEVAAIEGIVDANATLRFEPKTKNLEMNGGVVLRDGSLHILALSQELRDMRAKVTLAPNGTLRIEDVFARTGDGEVHASGAVKLDGLSLASAKAKVRIPEDHPIDLVVQGQPLGEISGEASLESVRSAAEKTTRMTVEVPEVAIELPQVLKTSVHELEEREKILVGHFREDGTFVRLPLNRTDVRTEEPARAKGGAAEKVVLDVRLRKVVVTRGNTVEVAVEGNPVVTIADETRVAGQIRATRGSVVVQGKEFEVQNAMATFTGDSPPNPTVVATATWTAADGTRVFAEFSGPVKSGQVTLRSEPPRPQHEVLALILFGTADGANPMPAGGRRRSDGTSTAAVGLGGGLVAEGLTEVIDDLTGVRATARIDTTLPNNPRPEIEFQISPRISIEFGRVIGTPPLYAPDKTLATFEWRFVRNWSLETTVGDRGTLKLDALWRKRY